MERTELLKRQQYISELQSQIDLNEYSLNYIFKPGHVVVVDKKFGLLLDDNQGYGYKSSLAAHKGYAYKRKHFTESIELTLVKQLEDQYSVQNSCTNINNEELYLQESEEAISDSSLYQYVYQLN